MPIKAVSTPIDACRVQNITKEDLNKNLRDAVE